MAGAGVVAQSMKRFPHIKFPQRQRPVPSVNGWLAGEVEKNFFVKVKESTSGSWGGKVCLLPKRAPLSAEEMEAILLGGCF